MTDRKDDRLWADASNANRMRVRRVPALVPFDEAVAVRNCRGSAWAKALEPIGFHRDEVKQRLPPSTKSRARAKRRSLARKMGADAEDVHHFVEKRSSKNSPLG